MVDPLEVIPPMSAAALAAHEELASWVKADSRLKSKMRADLVPKARLLGLNPLNLKTPELKRALIGEVQQGDPDYKGPSGPVGEAVVVTRSQVAQAAPIRRKTAEEEYLSQIGLVDEEDSDDAPPTKGRLKMEKKGKKEKKEKKAKKDTKKKDENKKRG